MIAEAGSGSGFTVSPAGAVDELKCLLRAAPGPPVLAGRLPLGYTHAGAGEAQPDTQVFCPPPPCEPLRPPMSGKTIRIFLVDGVPTGILTAEIINWSGKVVLAPRSQLDQLADRPEAHRTGVYLLVGADPELPARDLVYIGE